jgi:hypothetical protein
MNGEKRYHAEVLLTIEGRQARINVFADTLAEVFKDIGTICSQYPERIGPAKGEILNADRKAASIKGIPGPDKETGEFPVCETCGSSEFMELIKFTDKNTGKPRKAWKCQMCEKWHWPNGKKG